MRTIGKASPTIDAGTGNHGRRQLDTDFMIASKTAALLVSSDAALSTRLRGLSVAMSNLPLASTAK